MYRYSETATAGHVSECRANNDNDGLIRALTALWLQLPQRHDARDELENGAWNDVAEAGVVQDAVRAGIGLVRERKRLRPRAFARLVQNIRALTEAHDGRDELLDQPRELSRDSADTLLELATLVIDENWDPSAYLAPIFAALIEGRAKRSMWPFLKDNLQRLRETTAGWQLAVFSLATTSMGAGVELDEWTVEWQQRDDAAMWVASMHIDSIRSGTGPGDLTHLPPILRTAREKLPPDASQAYLLCSELELVLRGGNTDLFLELVNTHADELAALSDDSIERFLDHPVVRYANSFKINHPVVAKDFEHYRSRGAVTTGGLVRSTQANVNRVNQGIVELVRDLSLYEACAAKTMLIMRETLRMTGKDAAKARQLSRDMRAFKRPPSLTWVNKVWPPMLKQRAPLKTRLALAIFG